MMKTIRNIAGAVLLGATVVFGALLATAQTGDVAYRKKPQFVALDSPSKTSALLDVITNTWPSVTTFATVDSAHIWSTGKGIVCSLKHVVPASSLTAKQLRMLVGKSHVEINGGNLEITRRPTACGSGVGALATALGVQGASVGSLQCHREHPIQSDPGCTLVELKIASEDVWSADFLAGIAEKPIGTVD